MHFSHEITPENYPFASGFVIEFVPEIFSENFPEILPEFSPEIVLEFSPELTEFYNVFFLFFGKAY